MRPLIIIPSRLASTRLSEKALRPVRGKPMVWQVWQRAIEADIAEVVVATDHPRIAEVISEAGGRVAMTDPALPSGTDRTHAAWQSLPDAESYSHIICLQGDIPLLPAPVLPAVLHYCTQSAADIITVGCPLLHEDERTQPSVVKALYGTAIAENLYEAIDFTRDPPPADAAIFHHVGIYAYQAQSLARMVSLPQSRNEITRNLEQMRAMDDGMRIDIGYVDPSPLLNGIDTMADYEAIHRAHPL